MRAVDGVGLAGDVTTEGEGQLAGRLADGRLVDDLAEADDLQIDVWDLDTDDVAAGDRRSMRIERAASAMARSSARPSMRDSLMCASGRTSYCVTTGPVLVAVTVAGIEKLRSFSSMMRMLRRDRAAGQPARAGAG